MSKNKSMRILAIETSCDETAIAIVEGSGTAKSPKFKVLSSVISSQINIHRPFGGVVPNLAKREHIKNLPIVLKKALGKKFSVEKMDLIAVTVAPGLEPALWTGITFAKELAKKYKKPLIGANHMEGHVYSNWLDAKTPIPFPAIGLVVSGGHTILIVMKSMTQWKKIGETRDDAVGEAFDKVARLLELQYPGGPEIEKLSKKGNPRAVEFPRPMLHHKNYDFSFSGLKTSVLYYLRDHGKSTNNEFGTNKRIKFGNSNRNIRKFEKDSLFADIAASFQQAAIDVLVQKTMRAVKGYKAKSVFLCGGVAANKALRNALKKEATRVGIKFSAPNFKFNTDNAAMIAADAYMRFLQKKKLRLVAQSNLNL